MRRFFCLFVALLIAALPVQATSADEGAPDPNTISTPEAPLSQPPKEGGPAEINQAMEPNPYGCVGTTDNPHKSTHVGFTVNVVARTRCTVVVPKIYVETTLYRWQCWGPFCWYGTYGPKGSELRYGFDQASANSANTCVTGWYKGDSYHYIIGANGIRYEAWTSREAYVNC
jgi:hypothetical protein